MALSDPSLIGGLDIKQRIVLVLRDVEMLPGPKIAESILDQNKQYREHIRKQPLSLSARAARVFLGHPIVNPPKGIKLYIPLGELYQQKVISSRMLLSSERAPKTDRVPGDENTLYFYLTDLAREQLKTQPSSQGLVSLCDGHITDPISCSL